MTSRRFSSLGDHVSSSFQPQPPAQSPGRVAVIGAGRLGTALTRALRLSGCEGEGPLARGELPSIRASVVLLCVPDREISAAARLVPSRLTVGHCSGASGLDVLGSHRGFSLHPLMTVPEGGDTDFSGVPCAVAGDSVGVTIATVLGMRPISVADQDRPAYHAAACLASNFLVVLEEAAAQLAATAGVDRTDLMPLVRATVENWARLGPRALTGPAVRGDTATIATHRAVLVERAPELLALYNVMLEVARNEGRA